MTEKCKYQDKERCRVKAEMTNVHGVPMCKPCHAQWTYLKTKHGIRGELR